MSDKLARQRRNSLKTAGTAGAAVVAANFFVHAADKAGTKTAEMTVDVDDDCKWPRGESREVIRSK
jgi:hypothetical protein